MSFLQGYFDKMRKIQVKILCFIEERDNIEENYQNIIQLLKDHKIQEDKYDLKAFLYIISNISSNHNRTSDFFSKITKLFLYCKSEIKKNFSNFEVFKLFKHNKMILLILIKEEIITFDDQIVNLITNHKYYIQNYPQFFFNEIKPFFIPNQKIKKKQEKYEIDLNKLLLEVFSKDVPDDFEMKREKGENDDFICELIREDNISKFIYLVNKEFYSLNSQIKPSIYETNQYLIEMNPSLIEYAAFFGSEKIFKYLCKKGVNLEPSLWLYVVHSNTSEIVHILEDNNIKPEDQSYLQVISESIKCHHNCIAKYIIQNYYDSNNQKDINEFYIKYYNFLNFEDNDDDRFIFLLACKYDYIKIVNYFINNKVINLHDFEILNLIFYYVRNNVEEVKNESPFKFAALNDNIEIIELLLTKVNEIKNYFFRECSILSSLKVPSSITKIASAAFYKCYSLSNILLPSLLTYIGSACFHDCFSLKEITIPSSVTTIGMSAFEFCNSLISVTFELPSSIEIIQAKTFQYSKINEISIPPSVKMIDRHAFYKCFSLNKIEIPNSVTTIKRFAFYNCLALNEITIPSSVTTIEQSAFRSCSSLNKVNLSFSSIDTIEQYTFEKCIKLEKVKLPPIVKTIAKNAFAYCILLKEIIIPPSVSLIDSYAFHCCYKLEKIFIPSSVTLINEFAFQECESLKQIDFENPSSITTIEKCTFKSCSSLQQITIPSSVTIIKRSAFDSCFSLIEITIDCSVTSIECYAFHKCSSLIKITIPESVKTIGKFVFGRDQQLQQIFAPFHLDLSDCGINSSVDIQRY